MMNKRRTLGSQPRFVDVSQSYLFCDEQEDKEKDEEEEKKKPVKKVIDLPRFQQTLL